MKKEQKELIYIFMLLVGLVLISGSAFASEGGHHQEGIPYTTIMYQAINFLIVVGLLFYVLRKPAKEFFASKKELFENAKDKAQAIQKAAEEEHLQIKVRLTKLQSTQDETIAKARADAADLRKQLISEAEATSKRVLDEAKQAAELELEKAKQSLRETLIQESVLLARQSISTKVSVEDHKRLEGDFINSIGVINR